MQGQVATLVRDHAQGSTSNASEEICTSCAVMHLMDSHKSLTVDSRSMCAGRFRTRKTWDLLMRVVVLVDMIITILTKP